MIRTFRDRDTERLAFGFRVSRFSSFERDLQLASELSDLRIPPGNRLEALKGDRLGQYSIRINDQFRVCFRWVDGGAEDVEITDYH